MASTRRDIAYAKDAIEDTNMSSSHPSGCKCTICQYRRGASRGAISSLTPPAPVEPPTHTTADKELKKDQKKWYHEKKQQEKWEREVKKMKEEYERNKEYYDTHEHHSRGDHDDNEHNKSQTN
ncbi:hypothetical protein NUW58_g1141 [Xylaria curta]|uniref:Uncharacterized protein n=1 Tax=Xylaria curta TaxID=42375 RepID=A0ACC1PND1_9PEZI|nr:hypothetical protein NUW58_g1141 [Xylaria curta]